MKKRIKGKGVTAAALAVFMGLSALVAGPANAQEEGGPYGMFVMYIDRLNEGLERSFGEAFFTNVENKGDGTLEITATDMWINSPRNRRNAVDLHSRWKKMNSNAPVKIVFVNADGHPVAIMEDSPQGPRYSRADQ